MNEARILVIEDMALAIAVRRLIRAANPTAEVAVFSSIRTATAAPTDERRLDLAVLGLHLVDGSGVAIARGLRAAQPGLPLVFLTGEIYSQEVVEALALRPRALIQKPFLVEPLRIVIAQVLRARE